MLLNVSETSAMPPNKGKKTISFEYLASIDESLDIKTSNIDFNFLIANVEKVNLSIHLGLTATYATGSITQLEGSLELGTLKELYFTPIL